MLPFNNQWKNWPVYVVSASILLGGILMNIGCVRQDWQIPEHNLLTKWSQKFDPANVLPEYPRPNMVRAEWQNLNGLWEYAIVDKNKLRVDTFEGTILVPFPVESALSGVKRSVEPDQRLWYRRSFHIPSDWQNKRILLNFGAVDWETTVWVNGIMVGEHRGGYDAFSLDITAALNEGGEQTLVVAVWDPTDTGEQPRGKQVSSPGGIWYTAVTGIWQTVWLEPVPMDEGWIHALKIIPDIDESSVSVVVDIGAVSKEHAVEIKVKEEGNAIAGDKNKPGTLIKVPVPDQKLWSPDSPTLYDLEVVLLHNDKPVDRVDSYFGMRKIALGKDADGITRMMLNNEFVFQFGPLDQGWWPDGLYTAPTDEALRYDIEVTKKLGFNMARKHVKIEPARWYYWCDKLGLLVWQDMPSGGEYIGPDDPDAVRSEESARIYTTELFEMIDQFSHHPSIVVWVPFNEGWGQFKTEEITNLIMTKDPTRLVNPASGWTDRGVGDIHDIHAYPGPAMPEPEEKRAIVLGEFGGLGLPLEGHTWQQSDNWGYRSYTNSEELTTAYTDLLRELQGMIDRGLSAAVYTQTTDVEVEVNGLLTYDRAVVKMDPETVSRLAEGYLPPVIQSKHDIFLNTLDFRLNNELQQGDIYFTMDGSEPEKTARLYDGPVTLDKTATIKAKTYWPDGSVSVVSRRTFRKVNITKAVEAGALKKGVRYNYYEYSDSALEALPDFGSYEAKTMGTTDLMNTDAAERETYFMLRFEGYVTIPEDGVYTFFSNSDDGSKLYIHDRLVVNNDFHHGMTEKSGQIALARGAHPIVVEFFQGMGGQGLEVKYEGPGTGKKILRDELRYK